MIYNILGATSQEASRGNLKKKGMVQQQMKIQKENKHLPKYICNIKYR